MTPDRRPGARRRPTRQTFTVAAMGFLLSVAGATAQAGWLFVLSAGVFGLVAASLVAGARVRHLEVKRELPRRIRVGDDVRVGYRVRNGGPRRQSLAKLEDEFGAFGPAAVAVEALDPGAVGELETVRTALRRGVFDSGRVRIVSGAPFGLIRARRDVDVESPTVVVPRWVDLRSFPILEPASSPSESLHERARTGAGEEFLGVRDYRPGDPPRWVHWKSSARAGHLVVREFEEQATSRVAIAIAGRDAGEPPDSAFEMLVSAGASVALYALATGHPIDLVGWGGHSDVSRLHDVGRSGILEWFAGVRPSDGPLERVVTEAIKRAGRRSTIVLCTPLSADTGTAITDATKAIQASGSRVVVVAADESSWDARRGKAAPDLLGRLRLHRAAVRLVSKGDDLARCLQG